MAMVTLLVVGCGTRSEPVELTDSWLSRAISVVPAEYGSGFLYFANYVEARNAADAGGFMGMRTVRGDVPAPTSPSTGQPPWVREGFGSVPWTYSLMPPLYLNLRVYSKRVYDTMGLDFFLLDEMIGVDSIDREALTFMAVKGGAENHEELPEIIDEMGYYSSSHRGLPYYHWFINDLNRNPRRSREHPLRSAMWGDT